MNFGKRMLVAVIVITAVCECSIAAVCAAPPLVYAGSCGDRVVCVEDTKGYMVTGQPQTLQAAIE